MPRKALEDAEKLCIGGLRNVGETTKRLGAEAGLDLKGGNSLPRKALEDAEKLCSGGLNLGETTKRQVV